MPKIGDYPAATALTGTESVPVVQGGTTKKATAAQVADYNKTAITASAVAAAAVSAKATNARQTQITPPRQVTLISGQDDDTFTVLTNCTRTVDTVNTKIGGQAHKLTFAGAVTATATVDPLGPVAPLVFGVASAVMGWFYVTDASKVTSISLDIYSQAGPLWTRSLTNIVTGWNFFNQSASASTLTGWGTAIKARLTVVTSAATDINVGAVWVNCPPKAQVLYIDDRGYLSWYLNGYPALKALGVPCTIALDPTKMGDSPGTISEAMSEAQVLAFLADGNGNSLGIHGYDGSPTSAMTAAQLRTDDRRAYQQCERLGFTPMWRAAFVQNSAANAAAVQPYWPLGYATPSGGSSVTSFPFPDPYNIARYSLHGRTQADLDGIFTTLQATNQLLVCYTHAIDGAGGSNITQAMWDYFVAKVSAGITGGWLEGVTFESLQATAGTKFRRGIGATAVEYQDAAGARQSILLP